MVDFVVEIFAEAVDLFITFFIDYVIGVATKNRTDPKSK